jgi:hypothetical protein
MAVARSVHLGDTFAQVAPKRWSLQAPKHLLTSRIACSCIHRNAVEVLWVRMMVRTMEQAQPLPTPKLVGDYGLKPLAFLESAISLRFNCGCFMLQGTVSMPRRHRFCAPTSGNNATIPVTTYPYGAVNIRVLGRIKMVEFSLPSVHVQWDGGKGIQKACTQQRRRLSGESSGEGVLSILFIV